MALKIVDGKEKCVPEGAIPEAQRRQGALGTMDGMSLSEFRKMPLYEQLVLVSHARAEAGNIKKAKFLASKMVLIPSDDWGVNYSERYRYYDEAWAGIALVLAKQDKFNESCYIASRGAQYSNLSQGQAIASIGVVMAKFGATAEQLKPIFDYAVRAASHSDERGQFPYRELSRIAVDMAKVGLFDEALKTIHSIDGLYVGFLREEALVEIVSNFAKKVKEQARL